MIFNTAKGFYSKPEKLNNFLYLNMANETGDMLSSFEKYLNILNQEVPEGFSFDSDLITHENHSTSALVGQNVAYHKLFKKLQCPQDVINRGLVAILAFYRQLSKDYGKEKKPDYQIYRQAGYTASENNEYDRAIDIFETAIKEFPHVADAYYALAYVLESSGADKRALDMVNKALEMSRIENVENNSFKTFKAHLLNKLNKHAAQ